MEKSLCRLIVGETPLVCHRIGVRIFFFRRFILHDMKYREFALPLRSCVSCFGENRTGNGGKEKGVPFAEISIVEKAHGFYCQSFGSFKDEMLVVGYAVVENASQMSHRK